MGVGLVCLCIIQGLMLRSLRLRTQSCLPLPLRWRNASVAKQIREPSFVLLWSTDERSFTLRARRCLESILFHHALATVSVYSNHLPQSFFAPFRQGGYKVRVIRYNVTRVLMGTPAAPWLQRLSEWQQGPYYYSHLTDAIRLALLFRVGGVYVDTDVILTRPIMLTASASRTALNAAAASPSSRAPPPLHDALGLESYADPRTGLPTLNGAVMTFERGSRFLWNCLHEFASDYKADRWSWNGPELLTRVQLRCENAQGAAVQVEPPQTFYPLHWNDVARYADGQQPQADAALWEVVEQRSYAVHVWNRKTANLSFTKGSFLYQLHNTWMVLPDREPCT